MVCRSLVDITNSSHNKTMGHNKTAKDSNSMLESTKLGNHSMSFNNDQSIEASLNGGNMSKQGMLLAGESLSENELSKQLNDELDQFADQFGGPPSMMMTGVDDMMMSMGDMPTNGLDETPKNLDGDSDESGHSETEEVGGVKKSPSKSPRKKQRKSMNATITNFDDTNAEDTLDPSKNLTKRAKTMVSILNKSFGKQDNVGFFELARKNTRKHAAQKFYSLLVLKKFDIIDVYQADTYGDIIVTKGDKFENFTNT